MNLMILVEFKHTPGGILFLYYLLAHYLDEYQ